jgi:hypothetical protein
MGEEANVWFDRSANFISRGMNDSEDLDGASKSVNQVGNDSPQRAYDICHPNQYFLVHFM